MEAVQTASFQKDDYQMIEKNAEQIEEDQLKEEIAKEKKRLWDKWVGESLYFGDIADYMLLPFLMKKFYKLGLNFLEGRRDFYISDDVDQIVISADFMMKNDNKEMLVKMEKELNAEDVKDHIECLEMMRKYANLHSDSRQKSKYTFLGSVAGVVVEPNVKEYALEQGFFVIEPSGVAFNITPPNDQPKEW
jgi:hypothetical protein